MNREIKFRAWNKFVKKMIYFNNPHFNVEYRLFCFDSTDRDEVGYQNDLPGSYGMVKDDSSMTSYPTDTEELIDWEVMQYTGLKDKNWKEIYEGDIVRDIYTKLNEVVEYSNGSYGPFWDGTDGYIPPDIFEVVGNIYENKELLK
jgi:uncharacterized phage protein (TIGR01671 family)